MGTVGIVAGGGQFPRLVAEELRKRALKVVIIGLRGQTDQRLLECADVYEEIGLAQLGKLLRLLKRHRVDEVIFAGKVKKPSSLWQARPDLSALKLWHKLRSRNDDQLLRAVASELENQGFKVVSPTRYLDSILTPQGVLTKRAPTQDEWEDIRFGWEIAKAVGNLDIGQCVVVKERIVVAVEAMEGTDATILRAGTLAKDTVVIKICKPIQDRRFDLPSVGKGTIASMIKAQAKVLCIEAKQSLFFDQKEAIKQADQVGIAIVGVCDPLEG